MSQSIERLNKLSSSDAEAELLKCCGSTCWARAMSDARPFENVNEFLQKADVFCTSMRASDWLEAFRAHPRIGEKKAAAAQSEQAQNWSVREQSGLQEADANIKLALADGNREYEERFGFIYIVCATGKTAKEMLTNLNERLQNDPETELRVAAEEQRKITRLRLEKLLNQ